MVYLLIALAAQAAPQMTVAAPAAMQPLNLTCVGGGSANKTAYRSVQVEEKVRDKHGKPTGERRRISKSIAEPYTQPFSDQVDIQLFGGADQIRVPRILLPDLHGGKGGWFRLKNVTGDARMIDASMNLGILNNPKVHIDRVTGILTISGKAGDFSGQCHVMDMNAVPRF